MDCHAAVKGPHDHSQGGKTTTLVVPLSRRRPEPPATSKSDIKPSCRRRPSNITLLHTSRSERPAPPTTATDVPVQVTKITLQRRTQRKTRDDPTLRANPLADARDQAAAASEKHQKRCRGTMTCQTTVAKGAYGKHTSKPLHPTASKP